MGPYLQWLILSFQNIAKCSTEPWFKGRKGKWWQKLQGIPSCHRGSVQLELGYLRRLWLAFRRGVNSRCIYPGSRFVDYLLNGFFHKDYCIYCFSKGLFHQQFQGTILLLTAKTPWTIPGHRKDWGENIATKLGFWEGIFWSTPPNQGCQGHHQDSGLLYIFSRGSL